MGQARAASRGRDLGQTAHRARSLRRRDQAVDPWSQTADSSGALTGVTRRTATSGLPTIGRGRERLYGRPPAQIRASGITAHGSYLR